MEEYAQAVAIMKGRPAHDPTSWTYQAAMHGTHAQSVRPLWNGCQHGTWFFLAWHRLFIYYFERIVPEKTGKRLCEIGVGVAHSAGVDLRRMLVGFAAQTNGFGTLLRLAAGSRPLAIN